MFTLMAEGLSNQGIADRLVVSVAAVERHVTSIFVKLGVTPTSEDPSTSAGRYDLSPESIGATSEDRLCSARAEVLAQFVVAGRSWGRIPPRRTACELLGRSIGI